MKTAAERNKILLALLLISPLWGVSLTQAHAASDDTDEEYTIPSLRELKREKKEIKKELSGERKEKRAAKALIQKLKDGTATVEEVGFDPKASCIACMQQCPVGAIGLPTSGVSDGSRCVKIDLYSTTNPDAFMKAITKENLSKDQCEISINACGEVQAARKIKSLEKEIARHEDDIFDLKDEKKLVKQDIKVTRQLKDCPSCLEAYYEGRGSYSLLGSSSGAGSWGGISAGLGAYSGFSGGPGYGNYGGGFGLNTGLMFANQCTFGVPCGGSGLGFGLGLGLGLGAGFSPYGYSPYGYSPYSNFMNPYAMQQQQMVYFQMQQQQMMVAQMQAQQMQQAQWIRAVQSQQLQQALYAAQSQAYAAQANYQMILQQYAQLSYMNPLNQMVSSPYLTGYAPGFTSGIGLSLGVGLGAGTGYGLGGFGAGLGVYGQNYGLGAYGQGYGASGFGQNFGQGFGQGFGIGSGFGVGFGVGLGSGIGSYGYGGMGMGLGVGISAGFTKYRYGGIAGVGGRRARVASQYGDLSGDEGSEGRDYTAGAGSALPSNFLGSSGEDEFSDYGLTSLGILGPQQNMSYGLPALGGGRTF